MDDLQFERADFGSAASAVTCTGCHQPITGDYVPTMLAKFAT
jgi:hypothetical protein